MTNDSNYKIKACRKTYGMTQQQVADALGIERSTYTKYETGSATPQNATLFKIAKLFNTTVDYLLDSSAVFGDPQSTNYQPTSMIFTGSEKELIENYRKLTDEEKVSVIKFIESKFKNSDSKTNE